MRVMMILAGSSVGSTSRGGVFFSVRYTRSDLE